MFEHMFTARSPKQEGLRKFGLYTVRPNHLRGSDFFGIVLALSQGELPEPAKSLFRQAVRQLPEAKFRRLGAAGPGAGPGTLGRKKRLIHSFSALILVSNAKVIFASPFLQLDAPSAAPGWPVERRSVCSALCGAFRAAFSLPYQWSRLGGGSMDRLVSRGAVTRSKNIVAVALVAVAFPPPRTTAPPLRFRLQATATGDPGDTASHQESAGSERCAQSSIRAALQRRSR